MSSANQILNKQVELRLKNDSKEVRIFRYSLRGLMLIAEKYASMDNVVSTLKQSTDSGSFTMETLDALVLLVHAGLVKDDPSITKDQVIDLLDDNLDAITEAILKMMDDKPKTEGEGTQEASETFSGTTEKDS